jgi:hypothetical protein
VGVTSGALLWAFPNREETAKAAAQVDSDNIELMLGKTWNERVNDVLVAFAPIRGAISKKCRRGVTHKKQTGEVSQESDRLK